MLATVGVPDVHTPPVVVLASGVVAPAHSTIVPVIGATAAFTVVTVVRPQPVLNV
jgi:hypothetical protein